MKAFKNHLSPPSLKTYLLLISLGISIFLTLPHARANDGFIAGSILGLTVGSALQANHSSIEINKTYGPIRSYSRPHHSYVEREVYYDDYNDSDYNYRANRRDHRQIHRDIRRERRFNRNFHRQQQRSTFRSPRFRSPQHFQNNHQQRTFREVRPLRQPHNNGMSNHEYQYKLRFEQNNLR